MARKKDSPQKAALGELISTDLKENDVKVKDGTDVNAIMRDVMSVIFEDALDEEMNEELLISKAICANYMTSIFLTVPSAGSPIRFCQS